MKKYLLLIFILIINPVMIFPEGEYRESDVYSTQRGDLKIIFVGHASLIFQFAGNTIHVDPFSRVGDYNKFEKADMILITHNHGDHLDPELIKKIRKPGARVIAPELSGKEIKDCIILKNGDSKKLEGIKIEAVPAYNVVHKRKNKIPYHVKGEGNGYVITFGDKRVYVAGDTENIPEMKELKKVDIAFLPMNLPYTMTEKMVADAASAFKPAILYPYHFRGSDTEKLMKLLSGENQVKVLVRDLYKGSKKE